MIGKITDFNSAIAVNGTTVRCANQSLNNTTVIANDFIGIGGIKLEGHSVVQPTQLTVALTLSAANDTALTALHNNITDELGVTGTLTAEERGTATTKTCTAKLTHVEDILLSPYSLAWAKVELRFECYTGWV